MLAVHDLEIRVGARLLMENVSFRVADGDKAVRLLRRTMVPGSLLAVQRGTRPVHAVRWGNSSRARGGPRPRSGLKVSDPAHILTPHVRSGRTPTLRGTDVAAAATGLPTGSRPGTAHPAVKTLAAAPTTHAKGDAQRG